MYIRTLMNADFPIKYAVQLKFNRIMGFIWVYLRSSAVNLCESQGPFFLAFISRRPALHYPYGPRQHHALLLADKSAGGASHITTDSVPPCHHHKRNPRQRTRHIESWRPLGWGWSVDEGSEVVHVGRVT